MKLTYRHLKRAIDIFAAGAGLVVAAPVFAVTAALVRNRLGSPVLFRQQRPGLGGEPFVLLKFRTMLDVDPERGLISDEDRMTDFGRVLRATSLDELPSLVNVLTGDMSLVGPRPLLMRYLPLYTPHQARRHEVRPGVTGLAQVNGRNGIDWETRFEKDIEYVENMSLRLDAAIIWQTVRAVITRDGVTADGHVTVPVFTGSLN